MQQSTGVTTVVTEEMDWHMTTSTGSVRCVFLVVVSLLIDYVDRVPMGYQTLGTIDASTRRPPVLSFTKTVQQGRIDSSPFSNFPKCDWA